MLVMATRWLDRVIEAVSIALVVALLIVVSSGIFSRAAGHPFGFTDEASGYLMVWLACFGWMLASRRAAHIRIRFFLDRLPVRVRRVTEYVIYASAVLVGAVIAWKAIHLIETNIDVEAMSMPIAAAWLYVPLVPAGLVTVGQGVADFLACLADRNRESAA